MNIAKMIAVMVGLSLFPVAALSAEAAGNQAAGLANPLFAFDNCVGQGELSPEQQASLLAELGYDGLAHGGTENIPELLKALDAHQLKMLSIYVPVNLRAQGSTYNPGLPEAIRQLHGRGTLIWLYFPGVKPAPPSLDGQAVRLIREVAALADASGLRVALYPHTGMYVETVQDAVRLVKKVDRKNVGASLNLCHALKVDGERNLTGQIEAAMPYLFVVSINGADRGNTRQMGWDRLIQTLDRGDFDVYALLRTLKRLGYQGPIGLQCYGIRGDVRENLTRSIKAWQRFRTRMATENL